MTKPASPPTIVPLMRMNCRSRPTCSSSFSAVDSPSHFSTVEAMMSLYGLEEAAIHGMLYGICVFDSVIASVYIIGTSRMEGHSFLGLLRGHSAAEA